MKITTEQLEIYNKRIGEGGGEMNIEDDQDNFKLLKVSDVVKLLQQRNQDEQIAVYVGCAREFTSDYGWECSSEDDSPDLQIFTKGGLK